MITQNSVMNLLVAKALARTGTTALDPSASSYVITGEVVVTDLDGTILDSTTVVGKPAIRIVQSQGALLPSIKSAQIELSGVKTYSGKAYTAPVLQVDYVGYNPVTASGDIDVISDNGYEIMIHDIGSMAYGSTGIDKFAFYTSDASATKAEIINGLNLSMYENMAHVTRKQLVADRVSSNAGTAVTVDAGSETANLIWTNGSDKVYGDALGTDELFTTIAVGDYISPVSNYGLYKVTAITAGTASVSCFITLDVPYQGATATVSLATNKYVTAALFVAGSVGLRLTGLAPVFVSPQATKYYVNRWQTVLRNAGVTPAVAQVVATEGVGSYFATAQLEYMLLGNEGFIARNNVPYQDPRMNTVSTDTYGFITLEWDSTRSGNIFNQEAASKQLLIAFTTGGNREQLTGVVTSVQTVLNAWLNGKFTALALA